MAAEKEHKQREPVAVALTKQEWQTVLHWLSYGGDYHKAKKWETLSICKDKHLAAKLAAQHESAAAEAEQLHKKIEGVLYPAPPPETE